MSSASAMHLAIIRPDVRRSRKVLSTSSIYIVSPLIIVMETGGVGPHGKSAIPFDEVRATVAHCNARVNIALCSSFLWQHSFLINQ